MATTKSSSQRGRRRVAARPDWRHLPGPALLCVCRHLPDFAAFFAFAGTCREWRDVANSGKKAFMVSQPPLLCTTNGERFYSPVNHKCYKNHRVASVVRGLSAGTIDDVSQGYLVIKADGAAPVEKKLVLLNPFTQHMVDGLPRLFLRFVSWVVLTAPPTSPNCVVVVCSNTWLPHGRCTWDPRHDQMSLMWKQFVRYTRPGDSAGWTPFASEISFLDAYYKPVASPDGKVYAWALRDNQLEFVVMEFPHGEEPKLTRLRTFAFAERGHLYAVCLAEPGISRGGGDQHRLILVRASFMINNSTFEFYQLDDAAADSEQQQAALQKKKSGDDLDHMLGGRALVMGHYSCVAADNPAGWGGRAGDVYFNDGLRTGAWRFELRDNPAGAGAVAASSHYYAPWSGHHRGCYDMTPQSPLWLLPADTCS